MWAARPIILFWAVLLLLCAGAAFAAAAAFACSRAEDCSLAGRCVQGRCECVRGFRGATCAELSTLPTTADNGFRPTRATWGATV